jgi:potassium/hydrogen antiporter
MSQVILGLGLIFFLAFVFLALFDRTKIPDVLLLILVGVVLGPAVLGWGAPADFGKSGPVMSTIALIVVLLMGGIELDVDSLGKAVRPTLLLTLSCYAVTMLVMAVVGVYWLGLSWLVAMTMGAILGGTSSAVVIPLINGLQLRGYPATILTMESALTDVLTIVLATALMQAAATQGGSVLPGMLVGNIVSSMVMASIVGIAGGLAWLAAIPLAPKSHDFIIATVPFAFLVFGIAEMLGFNGGFAVLAFGLTLSNADRAGAQRLPGLRSLRFGKLGSGEHAANRQLQFLLKLFFFVYLGMSIPFHDWRLFAMAAAAVLVVYALRHALVALATDRRQLTCKHAAAMCALAPKGLAAAVLAGQPKLMGLAGGEAIEDFSFTVVLVSIVVTAVLIPAAQIPAVRPLYIRMAGLDDTVTLREPPTDEETW